MHKVDLSIERTPQQLNILLDTIKRNDDNILNKQEQDCYIEQIEHKLGIRNKNLEVLRDIEAGMSDIDDIG